MATEVALPPLDPHGDDTSSDDDYDSYSSDFESDDSCVDADPEVVVSPAVSGPGSPVHSGWKLIYRGVDPTPHSNRRRPAMIDGISVPTSVVPTLDASGRCMNDLVIVGHGRAQLIREKLAQK